MRMNQESVLTASNIVNEFESKELYKILKIGGVGKEAGSIVNAILKNRPINSAKELSQIIKSATLKFYKGKKLNPSALTFQAIRIAVNNEFGEIKKLLENVPSLAKPQARLVVICFHSLEDKIVTSTLRSFEKGENDKISLMVAKEEVKGIGKLITKKALVPTQEEIQENFASRSSLMRVFEFN